jgi:hypothetical protein
MIDLLRRFRGLAIALVVLAISAGAVFAGAPGLAPAAVRVQSEETPAGDPAVTTGEDDEDADEDADEEADEDADEEADEDADEDADEEDGTKPDDNHGAVVSAAAQAETPEGFGNHGQYVSCVARMDVEDPAAFDPTAVNLDDCGITPEEAKTTGKDKAAEKQAAGKAKAEAAKAKAAAKRAARAQGRP